jgi:hypothetical protein
MPGEATMVDLTPAESEEATPSPAAAPHVWEAAGTGRAVDADADAAPDRRPRGPVDNGARRELAKPDFMPAAEDDRAASPDDEARHRSARAQILAHAVRLAHLNGWRSVPSQYQLTAGDFSERDGYRLIINANDGRDPDAADKPERWAPVHIAAEKVLFDKSFAQAIWGTRERYGAPAWQYHLQQLTLSDDRLLYLGQHLYDEMP